MTAEERHEGQRGAERWHAGKGRGLKSHGTCCTRWAMWAPQCWLQFLQSYLDVSIAVLLSIHLYFVSDTDLKCLMSRHCCVKRLFPIRAIVINLCGCDNSAMFSVRLLRKCAFSRLICLAHSCVLGNAILTAPEPGKFSGSHINTLFMTREWQSLLYRLAVKQHVKDF